MLREYVRTHANPPVFLISGVVAVGFVLGGVLAPGHVSAVVGAANSFITTYFEWLYIIAGTFFLVFVVVLMVSRCGAVKLGPPDSPPEYSNLAWFAMLFTAGMGTGLVFYAVSGPVAHCLASPAGASRTADAAENAMSHTFFHWGLHPWVICIVLVLSLGYFAFHRGLPCVLRLPCTRFSESGSTAGSGTWWRSSPCSARYSAWPRRWDSVASR